MGFVNSQLYKSQGQTLLRQVKVDLNSVFEAGQAYVALSRATTLDGLEIQVLILQASRVQAHRQVLAWRTFWERQRTPDPLRERDTKEAMNRYWE